MKNSFAFLLRYAAQHADFFRFAGHIAKFTQTGEYLLGRFFTNAAGVVQDKGGGFDRVDLLVATGKQHAGHFFGIVVVHLAAECFEIKGPALRSITKKPLLWGTSRLTCGERFKADMERFFHVIREVYHSRSWGSSACIYSEQMSPTTSGRKFASHFQVSTL